MMMADVGGRIVVRGSRMAMPDEGPIPGSTPMRVPIRQPTVAQSRFCQVQAVMNPCSR